MNSLFMKNSQKIYQNVMSCFWIQFLLQVSGDNFFHTMNHVIDVNMQLCWCLTTHFLLNIYSIWVWYFGWLLPPLYFAKAEMFLILCNKGNSANQAIELLIQKGVPESHIIFLNLISVSVYSQFYLKQMTCKPFIV